MTNFQLLKAGCVILVVTGATGAQTVTEEQGESVKVFEAGSRPPVRGPKPEIEGVVKAIVQGTNGFREKEELAPLTVNAELTETAQYFADYMARTDRYGHTADDQQPAERAAAHGYEFCIVAENIAYQYSSTGFRTKVLAGKFVTGWKESPGHRRNMLDPDVTETGVAVAQSEQTGHYYAVQMFGRPKSQSLEFRIVNEADAEVQYELAGRTFTLPPRYERMHRLCRPSQSVLTIPNPSESDPEATREIKPESGDRLVVSGEEGAWDVQRERAETAE